MKIEEALLIVEDALTLKNHGHTTEEVVEAWELIKNEMGTLHRLAFPYSHSTVNHG